MHYTTIDKIAEVVRGSSPRPQGDPRYYGGNVPRLMVSDLTRDGMYVTPSIDFLTPEGAKKSRPMKKGDLIIAVSGNPGEPCILNVDACIHDGFVGFRNLNTKEVYTPYLYHFFKFNKNKNQSQAVGAIYKNLNTDQIKGIQIPLPPLEEQKKIAAILDVADDLRQKDKALVEKYNQLTQALFLDMFGDPYTNIKKFPLECLDDVCIKITDGEHGTVKRLESGKLYLMARNIRENFIDLEEVSYISDDDHKKIYKRCNPEKGDLLLVCVGATIGRSCIMPDMEPFSLARSVALLKPNYNKITSQYLYAYISSGYVQELIKKSGNSSAQSGLYTGKIKELKIQLPPLKLQEQYSEKVQIIEKQKAKAQASAQKSEELFNSLLQKAFKGKFV
jgi:type I restriction enzyme S subunit